MFSANLNFLFRNIQSLPGKYIASQKAGFLGVECGDVYNYPIQTILDVQRSTNLEQVLLDVYSGDARGFAAVPDQTEEFRKSLELSVQYCTALKCRRLHILSGEFPDNIEITEELKESYKETYISNLQYASKRLRNENITALIEPITTYPNYFLSMTDQALDILDQLACSNVKLQLDLYHHQRTHGNIADTLSTHLNMIGHIQVSQVPGRHEPDQNGEINYKFIFEYLKKIGYKGWIGCEYVPSQGECFKWMEPYKNGAQS